MAGHASLTHAERLAIRRLHLRHPSLSKSTIATRLRVSRASVYRSVEGIVRDKKAADGEFPELRAAYIADSNDATETGWVHVWVASLDLETSLLNAVLTDAGL